MNTEISKLSQKLDASLPKLNTLDSYWNGTQPATFLSAKSRDALGGGIQSLGVNFPKLAVSSLAERLTPIGFLEPGDDSKPDAELWKVWRKNHMDDCAAQAHIDALVYGRSFVIVWAGARGPQITVESPRQVAVLHDPATREVTSAFKRWRDGNVALGVLYLPNEIRHVKATANVTGDTYPTDGWETTKTIPNPLGAVPVVPIVNRGRLLDMDGVSEMTDLLGLTDALNKLMADAMVTSEHFARPRRWATGLELTEDEDGNVEEPFTNEANKVWVSEDSETKFGQFDAARLDGYSDMTATVTQQIGALSGLPPHYLGLHGDQPASADAIRSAEASLVAKAYALQRLFGQSWADVARLVVAVRDGVDPLEVDVETVWESPETRTPSQSADAAVKLKSIGVPLTVLLTEHMGYSPAQVDRVRTAMRTEALDAAGVDLTELVQ